MGFLNFLVNGVIIFYFINEKKIIIEEVLIEDYLFGINGVKEFNFIYGIEMIIVIIIKSEII